MLRQFLRNNHKRIRNPWFPADAGSGVVGIGDFINFTSSMQNISPHYTWWNSKYTDFWHQWTMFGRDWVARRHDVLTGGDPGSFLTGSANTTGGHQQYATLWSTINTGAASSSIASPYYIDLQTWYDDPTKNTTLTPKETAFLHYRAGDVKYGSYKHNSTSSISNPALLTLVNHGFVDQDIVNINNATAAGIKNGLYTASVIDLNSFTIPTASIAIIRGWSGSNQIGDGTITAANRKVGFLFSTTRWYMNMGHPISVQYHVSRSIRLVSGFERGIFWDETDGQGPGAGGGSGSVAVFVSAEYPLATGHTFGLPATLGYKVYMDDYRAMLGAISGAIAPKQCWVNPAAYYTFADEQSLMNAAGFGHCEQSIRTDWAQDLSQMAAFVTIEAMPKHPGFEMVAVGNWSDTYPNFPGAANPASLGASGAYTVRIRKIKASEWIQSWICMSGDPLFRKNQYINLNNYWDSASYPTSKSLTTPNNVRWLPMFERDIGTPIVPTFGKQIDLNINAPPLTNATFWTYDSTTRDVNNQIVNVKCRETEKALVFYRHASGSLFGNSQAATIQLPTGSWFWGILTESGSIITPTITTVDLMPGEGVVIMKLSSSVS